MTYTGEHLLVLYVILGQIHYSSHYDSLSSPVPVPVSPLITLKPLGCQEVIVSEALDSS